MAKKILIIEDEEVLLGFLENKLIKEGYEVSTAKDGEEGLKKIKEVGPDLILLDIVMPKMNGFEVLEKIKVNPDFKKIPVIIISNSGQSVELDYIRKLGVKDWLIKTEFSPKEVLKKVIKQIGR